MVPTFGIVVLVWGRLLTWRSRGVGKYVVSNQGELRLLSMNLGYICVCRYIGKGEFVSS